VAGNIMAGGRLGYLYISGGLDGSLTVTAGGAGTIYVYGYAAGNMDITDDVQSILCFGPMGSALTVTGSLGMLNANNTGGDALTGAINIGGRASMVFCYGNATAPIAVGTGLGTLTISGQLTNNITVTAGDLTTATIGSWGVAIDNGGINVLTGNMGNVTAFGTVQSSLLSALLNVGNIAIYGNMTDSIVRGARLSTVRVTGAITGGGPGFEIHATDPANSFRVSDATQSAVVTLLNSPVWFAGTRAWVGAF
jgi:hypothetical protein